MSNLSIECQVAELLRGAKAAMFANINDKIEITSLAERLRTDLKPIANLHRGYLDRGQCMENAATCSIIPDSVLTL